MHIKASLLDEKLDQQLPENTTDEQPKTLMKIIASKDVIASWVGTPKYRSR